MAGVNRVILLGNLGKDPESRSFESGALRVSFPLATTETYKNKNGERMESTEWHNVVLWRGLAEIAEKYLRKGSKVYVEGKIRTRSYEDKDGVKKYLTEIEADNLVMLDRRPDGTSGPSNMGGGYANTAPAANTASDAPMPAPTFTPPASNDDDDLPF